MLWDHKDFKMYDKVRIKSTNFIGHIDAITSDKYRIQTNDGYEWCHKYELEHVDVKKEIKKTDLRYL